ncbi:unnamed protein product [Plutella xylostella]|uniref:(diamondback moth) hypothetical protein n=1 Tax=Plutella xylostella TaxID=51655 RepID=A0A8S4EDU7_PLUXY|nr:unnamed protein product [Plutella xylostella]
MDARATVSCLAVLAMLVLAAASPEALDSKLEHVQSKPKKLHLQEGFYVEVPKESNATGKLLSFGVELNKDHDQGRGKQKKLLQRILPMFIMPFLIQSAIVPLFLGMLKFMLFKSLMVGKLALSLVILNAFKNHNSVKGREREDIASVHYGYNNNGMEEYGAYVN